MKIYTQLTKQQRYQTSALLRKGQTQTRIARIIGVSQSIVTRELKMRRQTVNEWLNHHTAFRLEVKQRRTQAWDQQQEKLSRLVCPVPGQLEAARHGYLRVLLMQNAARTPA